MASNEMQEELEYIYIHGMNKYMNEVQIKELCVVIRNTLGYKFYILHKRVNALKNLIIDLLLKPFLK